MGPGPVHRTARRHRRGARRSRSAPASRCVPVVSHDAVAFERYAAGHAGALLVVTDARRRELYWTAYVGVDELGLPRAVDGPGLGKPDELPHRRRCARFDAASVSAGALGMLAELPLRARPAVRRRRAALPALARCDPLAGPKRVTRDDRLAAPARDRGRPRRDHGAGARDLRDRRLVGAIDALRARRRARLLPRRLRAGRAGARSTATRACSRRAARARATSRPSRSRPARAGAASAAR